MTYAWLEAGFETEAVDLDHKRLIFRRAKESPDAAESPRRRSGRHPFIGSMKGTVTVAPGVDLTAPADPEWGEIAYGNDK